MAAALYFQEQQNANSLLIAQLSGALNSPVRTEPYRFTYQPPAQGFGFGNAGAMQGTGSSNEFRIPCQKKTDKVALLLWPTSDHNGAFNEKDADLQNRLKTMSKEFNISFKRVSNVQQALEAAFTEQSMDHKIAHLELGGHGTPRSLHWGSGAEGAISTTSAKEPLKLLFSLLEKDAAILTVSCLNGKALQNEDNFLTHLARLAPGHLVKGTEVENGKHLTLLVTSLEPFQVIYLDNNGKDVTREAFIPKL